MSPNAVLVFLADSPSFWESNLASAIIGAVVALVVVAVTEAISRQRGELESLQSQIDDLTMAVKEIEFYLPILEEVRRQTSVAGNDMSFEREQFVLPSFRLDVSLLQTLRRSLAENSANSDVVLALTKCAYEMDHVQNRLDLIDRKVDLVRQTTKPEYLGAMIRRVCGGITQGTAGLAGTTIEVLQKAVPLLTAEITRCEQKHSALETFKILPR